MATTRKTASTSKTTTSAEKSTKASSKTAATKSAPAKKPVNVEKALKESKDTKAPECDCSYEKCETCETCSCEKSIPDNIVPWSKFAEELKELCEKNGVNLEGYTSVELLKNIVTLSKRYDLVDRKGQVSSNKAFNMITAMLDGQGRVIDELKKDINAIMLANNAQFTVVEKIAKEMPKSCEVPSTTLESAKTLRIRKKDIRKIQRIVRHEIQNRFRYR